MNNNWKNSRPAYVAYRDAKRKVNLLNRDTNRASRRYDNALLKYMNTSSQSLVHSETDYSQELMKTYQEYRASKLHHDACRNAFDETIRNFRDKEIGYSIVIFKGLIKYFNLTIANISNLYGIWDSNIVRWIGKGRSKELLNVYEKEYAIDKDESCDN